MMLDDEIMLAIKEHDGLTCPDLTRIIYPDAKEWDKYSLTSKINRHCNKLHRHGYLTKQDTEDGLIWGLA